MYQSEKDARVAVHDLGTQKGLKKVMMVAEAGSLEDDRQIIADIPLRFGNRKEYREREVYVTYYE